MNKLQLFKQQICKDQVKEQKDQRLFIKRPALFYQECHDDICHINILDDQSQVCSIVFNNGSHNRARKRNLIKRQAEQPQSPLEILAKKSNSIKIINLNEIVGGFGHASFIMKRPIIQGTYYLEIKIMPNRHQIVKQMTQPSSVRVGVAPANFKFMYPLGCDQSQSIAYKSSDGRIIQNGVTLKASQRFDEADTIGVVIKMAPPYKHPKPHLKMKDSSVSFYKNGKFLYQFKQLKQKFYCFAIGLFNYSHIKVLEPKQFPITQNSLHYYQVLNEEILYKDLADNQLFKIRSI